MNRSASRFGRRALLIAAAVVLPGGLLIPIYYLIRRIRHARRTPSQS